MNGVGFLGQDAAKLWSGLQKNPVAQQALLEQYAQQPNDTLHEARRKGLAFGVVVENLTHIVWRQENVIAQGKTELFSHTNEEIEKFLQTIQKIMAAFDKEA